MSWVKAIPSRISKLIKLNLFDKWLMSGIREFEGN